MSKAPGKTDIWYPFFVGDYRKDTGRLSCEQHGAYRQLLDEYWVAGPLPDDDETLARVVGLDLRTWRKHRPVIVAFFKVKGGRWRHKRVDEELAKASVRKVRAHDRAQAAANARWGAERARNDATGNASGMLGASSEQCLDPCLRDALHQSSVTGSALSIQRVSSDSQEEAEGKVIPLDGRAGR